MGKCLCRDPYATFLAEYKRLRTHDYSACSLAEVEGKACVGGHVSVINRADFNRTDFRYGLVSNKQLPWMSPMAVEERLRETQRD